MRHQISIALLLAILQTVHVVTPLTLGYKPVRKHHDPDPVADAQPVVNPNPTVSLKELDAAPAASEEEKAPAKQEETVVEHVTKEEVSPTQEEADKPEVVVDKEVHKEEEAKPEQANSETSAPEEIGERPVEAKPVKETEETVPSVGVEQNDVVPEPEKVVEASPEVHEEVHEVASNVKPADEEDKKEPANPEVVAPSDPDTPEHVPPKPLHFPKPAVEVDDRRKESVKVTPAPAGESEENHAPVAEVVENAPVEESPVAEPAKVDSSPAVEDHSTAAPKESVEVSSSTVPNLNYVPSKPFHAQYPDHYPRPINTDKVDAPGKPETKPEDETPSSVRPSTVPSLEYEPSKVPTYLPDPPQYPQPIDQNVLIDSETSEKEPEEDNEVQSFVTVKPCTDSETNASPEGAAAPEAPHKEDEAPEKVENVPATSGQEVPSLEYKPIKPSFLPDPPHYPRPVENKPVVENDEENEPPVAPKPEESVPESPSLEVTPSKPAHHNKPTMNAAASVPNLSYVPNRPFYAGSKPQVYPVPITSTETSEVSSEAPQEEEEKKPSTASPVSPEEEPSKPSYLPEKPVHPKPVTEQSKPEAEESGPKPQPPSTSTPSQYEDLLYNLQQLINYVQSQHAATSQPVGEKNTPQPQDNIYSLNHDLEYIAQVIRPLFTPTPAISSTRSPPPELR